MATLLRRAQTCCGNLDRRRGLFVQANELPKLRILVQAIEVRILRCPVPVTVSGRESLLERFQRLGLSSKPAIRACGVVKRDGIAGTKSHSCLQVPDALFSLAKGRKVAREEDARSHIFGD